MSNLSVSRQTKIQINQGPQGILKRKSNQDQNSPGILVEPKPIFKSNKKYKSLSVNKIKPYKGIDDYIELTTSSYPTVVKTPTHCYCIDGNNLVEKAKQENSESILCLVFKVETISEIELALYKANIRVVSDQGKPYYAELVRNCKKVLALLMQSTENPVLYSHGGKRKGINYSVNREENIRTLIAEHFGKSVSTINKYINYGEDVPEDILGTLVQSKEGKRLFEAVASSKRRFIKNLKCEGNDAPMVLILRWPQTVPALFIDFVIVYNFCLSFFTLLLFPEFL